MQEIDKNEIQEEFSAESFIDLDDNIVATLSISRDANIAPEMLDPEERKYINKDIDDVDVDV